MFKGKVEVILFIILFNFIFLYELFGWFRSFNFVVVLGVNRLLGEVFWVIVSCDCGYGFF